MDFMVLRTTALVSLLSTTLNQPPKPTKASRGGKLNSCQESFAYLFSFYLSRHLHQRLLNRFHWSSSSVLSGTLLLRKNMENILPEPEAMKAERDIEEVTQKLKTESEEEPLAALPAFPVPVTDQHNDALKERQQAKEPMKLFEFVHHSVDTDNKDYLQQVQIKLAGNMHPNLGNLPEVLNTLEENLNRAQDLLEAKGLLPAPCCSTRRVIYTRNK
jgi:hypothetical protein